MPYPVPVYLTRKGRGKSAQEFIVRPADYDEEIHVAIVDENPSHPDDPKPAPKPAAKKAE